MGHIQRNGLIYEAGIWDTFRGMLIYEAGIWDTFRGMG